MYSAMTRFGLVVLMLATAPLCLAQGTPSPVVLPAGTPQAPPATQTTSPPQAPAQLRPLDPKVQQVLTQARHAYKAARSYQDLGTVVTTMVIAGRTADNTSPASTTFTPPGKFISNYEAMSLYSDGQTLWIYSPSRGKYYQQPLEQQPPAGATPTPQSIIRNLPILSILTNPDQSLLATATAFESAHRGQEQLAGHLVDHVTLVSPADVWFGATDQTASVANRILIDMFFDAQTHMLLRLNIDMTGAMRNRITRLDQQRDTTQINQATWQFNAGQVRLGAPVPAETFGFKPPANAEQVETVAALFTTTGGNAPVNDEEQSERHEQAQSRLPYAAPDFTLPDLAGQKVTLGSLRGKVVLLDFWATWCGPCRASLPHIQKLHDDLASKGLVVLGIDLGEDSQTVLDFVEKNKMTFRILLDEEDKVSPLYHVSAIPHTVIIDQKGQVVKLYTGVTPERELRGAVESVLTGSSATQPAAVSTTQPASRPAGTATRPAPTD